MDLSQAESVADIIHSKTSDFAKISMKNLSGVLKEKVNDIRNDIFEVLSKITAGIDFPEDVREPEYSYLIESFDSIIKQIDSVLAGADTSNIFRQGASAKDVAAGSAVGALSGLVFGALAKVFEENFAKENLKQVTLSLLLLLQCFLFCLFFSIISIKTTIKKLVF